MGRKRKKCYLNVSKKSSEPKKDPVGKKSTSSFPVDLGKQLPENASRGGQ